MLSQVILDPDAVGVIFYAVSARYDTYLMKLTKYAKTCCIAVSLLRS